MSVLDSSVLVSFTFFNQREGLGRNDRKEEREKVNCLNCVKEMFHYSMSMSESHSFKSETIFTFNFSYDFVILFFFVVNVLLCVIYKVCIGMYVREKQLIYFVSATIPSFGDAQIQRHLLYFIFQSSFFSFFFFVPDSSIQVFSK